MERKKTWTEFVVKEDLDRMKEYHRLRRSDSGTAPRNYEFRFIDRSGNLHDIYLTIQMIPGTKKSVASMLDITERKRAEAALYEEREQLAVTLRSIGDGVIVTDRDGNLTLLNKMAEELTGWSKQEASGRPLSEVFHIINEKTREVCENPVEKVLETGLVFGLANDTALIARDGTERSIADSGAPIRDKDNTTIGVVLVFRDVTEEKRAEEALHDAALRWQSTFDSTQDAMCLFDADQRIMMCNRTMQEIVGAKNADELVGRHCWEVVHGTTEPIPGCPIVRMRASLKRETMELKIGDRWFAVTVDPILDETLALVGAVHNIRDITDLKKVEEELAAAHRKMLDILEFLPDATLVIDSDGRVIAWNRAMEVMTGVKAEDMIGKGDYEYAVPFYGERRPIMIDLVFAGEDELMRKEYSHIRREGNVLIADTALPRPLGKRVVPMGTASSLYDNSGRVVGAIESIRDITDRKAAERALEMANKKLQLLSGVTRHDILNQVTALAGYTDFLGEVLPDDPEMRNYIDRIAEATSAIERQITFTRDYERLGVDPSQWERVGDVAQRAASGCADHNVNVSTDTGALEVFTDPMLEKVFFNLFDNAVRHGEHVTEISVTCREEDGTMVIAVEDNGVGIPAEMKERIFRQGFGEIPVTVSSWYRRFLRSPGCRSGRPVKRGKAHALRSLCRQVDGVGVKISLHEWDLKGVYVCFIHRSAGMHGQCSADEFHNCNLVQQISIFPGYAVGC